MKVNLNTFLHKDRNVVELNLQPEGQEPWGHIDLEPDHVLGLINLLVDLRMQMTPAIVGEKPEGAQKAILDPRYWVQPEPLTEGASVSLQHPGFGWLSFVIPPGSLETLVQLLTVNLERLKTALASSTPKRLN